MVKWTVPQQPSAAENTTKLVAKAGSIMVVSLTLSRVLGLLRDTAIASEFGLRLANDSYRIAIQVPDLLYMLIAGGGLSSAFIPVFAEYLHTGREKDAWKVFSVVVTICSLIVLALVSAAWIGAPAIVNFIGQGQNPKALPDAILMSRIMLPAQFAFLIGSVLLATLYARKEFMAPGLAPNVYNVGIIVGATVLPAAFGFGIEGVAWGALFGALIGNLVIPISVMLRKRDHFRPSLDTSHPGVRKFFVLLLPVIVGFSLPSMVTIITQKFASSYGEGANTALGYANNLMQAPFGIFGQSLALAVFPVLAQFVAQNRMDLYQVQVSKTLRQVIYLGMPSSVLLGALAPSLVHVIYGYGKAQDPQQLSLIAGLLRVYCVGIFAWCMQPVLMRGFFSLHKTFKPIAISTGFTGFFIVECVFLTANHMDIHMVPWATNIAAILLVIALFIALEMDVAKLDRKGILLTLGKSALGSFGLGVAAYLGGLAVPAVSSAIGRLHLPGAHRVAEIFAVGAVCLVAAWVYHFITAALGMPETQYLARAMRRLPGSRKRVGSSETDLQ